MHPGYLLFAVGVAALLAGKRAADPQERDGARAFESLRRRLDLDFDGKVSESEFKRGRAAFRRRDRDHDGFLTAADFAAGDGEDAKAAAEGSPAEVRLATAEEVKFFEEKIRPVLASACYSCHSASAAKLKSGLRVDSRAALLAGGDTGAAIVPGDADGSLLIQAIRHDDPDFAMPPKEKLADEAIHDLERWVALGAPWPAEPAGAEDATHESFGRKIDIEAGKHFWSFQPPVRSAPPATKDAKWAWSDVDRFLLSAMEARGVAPVGEADKRTWLRRVSFDLTGLPPTPAEAAAFEADRAKDAYETVVDRLLASPAFGERFGRHWLDVARYGESSGKDSNVVYPHAWRYRDWVIAAFNADMPYDRFLERQLAGDLLPGARRSKVLRRPRARPPCR